MEVHEAVKNGYIILKVYEVWHWPAKSEYDPISKTGGIFTDYVNLFLRYKQQASNFPDWVKTEDDKDKYVQLFYDKEGIQLDKTKIKYNNGVRSVNKLLLNSNWGRLGMNEENRIMVKYIKKPEEWYLMQSDTNYIIHDVNFHDNYVLQVFYSNNKNNNDGVDISVVHAAFVTAYGRLKLYSEMIKLNERVLYFDTDSIFYIHRENEYNPKLGDYLGEFTNEISVEEGSFATEFGSLGKKNYFYNTKNNNEHIVVKGFKLLHKTKLLLNIDSMKDILLNEENRNNKKIEIDELKFIRDKKEWNIKCKQSKKLYGFVYDTRILKEDLTTLPYGYKYNTN